MVRHRRAPRGLVALEPGRIHPERVEHELAVHLVELAAGRLLRENAGDHVSGVRVFEAFARTEMAASDAACSSSFGLAGLPVSASTTR